MDWNKMRNEFVIFWFYYKIIVRLTNYKYAMSYTRSTVTVYSCIKSLVKTGWVASENRIFNSSKNAQLIQVKVTQSWICVRLTHDNFRVGLKSGHEVVLGLKVSPFPVQEFSSWQLKSCGVSQSKIPKLGMDPKGSNSKTTWKLNFCTLRNNILDISMSASPFWWGRVPELRCQPVLDLNVFSD